MKVKLGTKVADMLKFINDYGVSAFDSKKIEQLERLILECNEAMKGDASGSISDSLYDKIYDTLKQVNPDSEILSQVWDYGDDKITDYMSLLDKNPMMSIETAKSYDCDAVVNFINRLPSSPESYFASYKINGHGIRIVYQDGYLVSATSRMRSSSTGKDLTRHMKIILGDYNEALGEYGLVELRGELCLSLDKLDEAREFNPQIVSAFSAVASLSRPSATEDEIRLLDFLCYGIIMDDYYFSGREEEFQEIQRLGYKTPEYMFIESATPTELSGMLRDLIASFEDAYDEFGYFCDGVVLEIDDRELFAELGTEGNHNLGNIALKVGLWEQSQYYGYVQKILWTKGKVKLSPVAIIAEMPDMLEEDIYGKAINWNDLGVVTAQGNKVRRVPLYEPRNIMVLGAYVGEPVYFRYGGEAGVVPCFPDGSLLKDDAVRNAANIWDSEDDWE